jgi:putative ABC transport system substrate-binding protein
MNATENDALGQAAIAALQQALQQLGWNVGRNVQIETRWGANNVDRDRRYAAELVALAPNVILASGTVSVAAMQRATSTLPIVFVRVTDPVGAGFVNTLARPGGNITGFMLSEYNLAAKWVELLKEISPQLKRVGVLRDPSNSAAIAQFSVIQAVSQPLGVEVVPINVRDASEIERDVAAFARAPHGGLIVQPTAGVTIGSGLIISLAARHKLPTVYGNTYDVTIGGLASYGPDRLDQYRRAAVYVDRILKGEKPADMPVQAPTKYELLINLRAAKALGLAMPPSVLARADRVIE